jgi:hypothetical protein
MKFRSLSILFIASASVAACTYDDGPDPNWHFFKMQMDAPKGNTVVVCHAYGCKMKTPYRFTSTNIAEITREMQRVKRNNSPEEERRAIAYAIALMERQVALRSALTTRPACSGPHPAMPRKRTALMTQPTRQAS